jgi:phospholipid/cholesterol/gamma-HCH transport system substrate-binding protein
MPRIRMPRIGMKRTFGERNPVRIGIAGILGLVLLALLALNSGTIIRHLTTTTYQADFGDAAGLAPGDSVQVSGLTMGSVDAVTLESDYVRVTFSVRHGGHLGALTGATISSATLLGTKELTLQPDGQGTLQPGATIPLSRTTSPYDLTQVLSTLTTQAGQVNAGQLADAFNTIAGTLKDAPPELRETLHGVEGLSETIASRDGALTQLTQVADKVTGVLAQRTQQVRALITDGDELLATLYERRAEIRELLANVTLVADQLKGLAADNQRQLGPALHQLQGTLNLLNRNNANLTAAINGLERYAGSLGEAVGSGPWFYAYIANLAPTNLVPLLPTLLGK